EKVTPPSRLTELPIPSRIEEIVMQLLEKDPANRPQTAAELADLFCELPHSWTQARAEAWWRANVPDILAASREPCRGGS
ncbi:MAG TPA: hypothetical protein VGC41_29550, partial [Kofleriaceae bacterium]